MQIRKCVHTRVDIIHIHTFIHTFVHSTYVHVRACMQPTRTCYPVYARYMFYMCTSIHSRIRMKIIIDYMQIRKCVPTRGYIIHIHTFNHTVAHIRAYMNVDLLSCVCQIQVLLRRSMKYSSTDVVIQPSFASALSFSSPFQCFLYSCFCSKG